MTAEPLVLAVDDEAGILRLIKLELSTQGFRVVTAENGEGGLRMAEEHRPDIVLLDIVMPDMTGLEVMRKLRERTNIPVILLTAKGSDADKVRGLEMGADDYVTKPFSPKEVVARVRALLRRSRSQAPGPLLRHGSVTMDLDRHVVSDGGQEVRLTAKEFLLLRYFLQHPGRVLSRDLLLTDVWDYRYTGGTRTVDVHVRRLREKLPSLADAILTIKQFGYKLADPS